jgi:hypothetical protein
MSDRFAMRSQEIILEYSGVLRYCMMNVLYGEEYGKGGVGHFIVTHNKFKNTAFLLIKYIYN